MLKKVEFRGNNGKFEVYRDGIPLRWSCDAIVVSMTVSHPKTGQPIMLSVVKRVHPQFKTQSTLVFDGAKPREDDWFSGELFGSIEPTESGVTVWSTKKAQLEYPWPTR